MPVPKRAQTVLIASFLYCYFTEIKRPVFVAANSILYCYFTESDGLRTVATSSLFTVIFRDWRTTYCGDKQFVYCYFTEISRPRNYCRNKHAASFILSDRFTHHVLSRQQLLYCYFTEIDILRIVATSGFFAVILQRLTNHVLSRQAAYLLLFYRD